MASKELYKRFTSLCQKWPKDETKAGRDYGEYFRTQLMQHFPDGGLSECKNTMAVTSAINSLENLVNNQYYKENPLKRSSASGLEAIACREAISNEGIKAIQESEEDTLITRLKDALRMKFTGSNLDLKTEKSQDAEKASEKCER